MQKKKKNQVPLSCFHVPQLYLHSPGGRFSKDPETFRTRKAIAKSPTLRLQSCFIHIFLIWKEVPFIQEVSGIYTSSFLHIDELKMALRARKVSVAFEKRAPAHYLLYVTVWLFLLYFILVITVKPRLNEVVGDRPNLFVKWRGFFISKTSW